MEIKSCLTCTNFATCETINKLKDDKGLVNIRETEIYGSECSKYFNPKL